ncbi:MAG TPA: adenosylcobinamide-GDP ribazoletransferase, partial [Methanomassiliicoccales archaeon]|nr:adenosylcobinamide-GDP ribazoletransferase [Methanomassiliicoccales archaeon]
SGDSHEGLGGMFVQNTDQGSVVIAAVIALAVLVLPWLLLKPDYISMAESLFILVGLIVAAIVAGAAVANRAMKHFGSVNGDILGATNEVARPTVLLAFFVMLWLIAQLP